MDGNATVRSGAGDDALTRDLSTRDVPTRGVSTRDERNRDLAAAAAAADDDAATVVPPPHATGGARELWAAYERVGDRLRRVAFRVLNDAHEAEDAVHDAFVSAHGSIQRLRDPALLENWLVRIVKNSASTRLRHRRRCRPDFRLFADEAPAGWDLPRVLARFGSAEPPPESVAALRAEFDSIPAAWRTAFEARVLRGLSIPQIAVEQGVTAACVKTRISRVSSRLRRSI